jgi:D-alanyl-D-alanine carboxypeptidase
MWISRKTVLPCLVFIILFAVIVFSSSETAANSGRVLSSRYKFSPHTERIVNNRHNSANIVRLRRDDDSKSRPTPDQKFIAGALPSRISSRTAIVLDANTGETLYARSPDLAGQPASTIKILTGFIAINSLRNKERVKVSRRAARMPRSKIYLRSGRSYRADDLINALLLSSANDAAVALAEKIGGSESTFTKLMNAKARQLGARDTVCRSATGLTHRGQKTTARDLAVMFNQVMKNKEFADRISQVKVRTSYGKVLRNHNRALWQVAGTEGGKTGYTRLARQTYVGKFRRGQEELLVAIMGSETMWHDINTLVEYGFSCEKKVAADHRQEKYGADIVQLKQIDSKSENPLLVVLTQGKKFSEL